MSVFLIALAWSLAVILAAAIFLLAASAALSVAGKAIDYLLDRECCDD